MPEILKMKITRMKKGNEHPVSSSSIKPVVDYYINNSNHNEQLSIPPYGTRSYKDTFQLIFTKTTYVITNLLFIMV